jgi:hypothetical protein
VAVVDGLIPAARDKLVNNGVLKPGFGVLFHGVCLCVFV